MFLAKKRRRQFIGGEQTWPDILVQASGQHPVQPETMIVTEEPQPYDHGRKPWCKKFTTNSGKP